jgi:hypothetical protein
LAEQQVENLAGLNKFSGDSGNFRKIKKPRTSINTGVGNSSATPETEKVAAGSPLSPGSSGQAARQSHQHSSALVAGSFNAEDPQDVEILNQATWLVMTALSEALPELRERRRMYKRTPQLNFIQFHCLSMFIRKVKKRMHKKIKQRQSELFWNDSTASAGLISPPETPSKTQSKP